MPVTGWLKVNPTELRTHGAAMESSADSIPEAPPAFTAPGSDPLSLALQEKTQQVEAPFINGIPQTKADAQGTARNIQTAADKYEQADQHAAGNVQSAAPGLGGSGAGGGESAGGMQGLQQLQQMAQMPMQMAQTMAQMPMQMAQMAGQIPQAVMQGVQQIAQMTGGMGQTADSASGKPGGDPSAQPGQPSTEPVDDKHGDEDRDEREKDDGSDDRRGPASEGADSGAPAERAPVSPSAPPPATHRPEFGATPPVAAGPRPAPTDPSILL